MDDVKVDIIEDTNHWDSCCIGKSSDKRLLIFIANLTISISLLSFSFVRLCSTLTENEQSIYIGFITLIVGIWVKSPSS
jgi:hypothetical protein